MVGDVNMFFSRDKSPDQSEGSRDRGGEESVVAEIDIMIAGYSNIPIIDGTQ